MTSSVLNQTNQVVEKIVPQPQYYCYDELLISGQQNIDTSIFTNIDILDSHFDQILKIMQDGIETPQIQDSILYVHFTDNESVKLSIFDYWFNLLFWGLPVMAGHPIDSRYLVFFDAITQSKIANYVNKKFLKYDRSRYYNKAINNMMDEVFYKFQYIDIFALYLYNTANNEDTVKLMKENKDFYDCVHCDLSQVPIESIKDIGMDYTNNGIKHILDSGFHWAIPYFMAGEGINIKQFREFLFNIGTVPNDEGGVYPRVINNNFSNRGITNPIDYIVEAAKARKAQMLSHQNVALSGAFARILGLNNMDDRLHPDPNYVCNSKHFVKIKIKNRRSLSMYKNRNYRFKENGIEYQIPPDPDMQNEELIGQEILVRSPITCASRARGEGICHRCYGGLAKTNYDINIGKIAAELMSSELTQRMLSAKHLLETYIKTLKWTKAFYMFFDVDFNSIRLKEDMDFKKYKMYIHQDAIMSDNDDDDSTDGIKFDKYVTSFIVVDPKGNEYVIGTTEEDSMFFSVDLEVMLRRRNPDGDGLYTIQLTDLKDSVLFFIEVVNSELSSALEHIQSIINKNAEVNKLKTKDNMTQELVDTIIESGLSVDAIHLETILSHQCVSKDSILLEPHWEYPNAEYQMVTLNQRLKGNPSVTVSLMYKDINKLLFYPLTFAKTKPSVLDLFFMTKPQNYMSYEPVETDIKDDKEVEGMIKPFTINIDKDTEKDTVS